MGLEVIPLHRGQWSVYTVLCSARAIQTQTLVNTFLTFPSRIFINYRWSLGYKGSFVHTPQRHPFPYTSSRLSDHPGPVLFFLCCWTNDSGMSLFRLWCMDSDLFFCPFRSHGSLFILNVIAYPLRNISSTYSSLSWNLSNVHAGQHLLPVCLSKN